MSETSDRSEGARSEHVVLPEVETLVSIPTVPNAVCHLHHASAEGPLLQLDADDGGVVRFHAKAPQGAQPVEFRLECTGGDGKKTNHVVAVRGDSHHGAQAG